MDKLKNKVAVITGGTGGIGLATAHLFLDHGAKVVLVDNNDKDIKKYKSELNHRNISFVVADVSKKEDTVKFIDFTLKTYGRIDIFFANAGIEGVASSIETYPEETFDKVIAVNLKGVWLGC